MLSLTVFLIGSSLCGLAWSANSLIAFRVLQGLGGGMILPIGQSMLARAAGPQRMGRVMSVIGAPTVLGPILGPVLGGLIVSNFSWRWIFYINVPIGIVTLVLASRFLKAGNEEKVAHQLRPRRFRPPLTWPGRARLLALRGGGHRQDHQRARRGELRPGRRAHGRIRRPRPAGPKSAPRPAPVQEPQLHHRQHLLVRPGRDLVRLHVHFAALLPDRPRAEPVASRPPHGTAGHRGRPHDAQVRGDHRPARATSSRPAGHPHHGGGHHPLRLRHLGHQRSIPVGRHPVRTGPGARAHA